MTIYINGKFLAQRTTGVQRFSRGVLCALDRSLRLCPIDQQVIVLLPPSAPKLDSLEFVQQRHVGPAGNSLTFWEQFYLPFHARDGILLCLSGSAPFFARRCIPTIHDAAVYRYPEAYSRLFVSWYRLLFKYRSSRSPVALTVSKSSAVDLSAVLRKATFRVIPNSAEHITEAPADLSIVSDLNLEGGRFLLAVGSFNATKNFSTLINAYLGSKLVDEIPLVIVGALNRNVFRGKFGIDKHPNLLWAGAVTDAQLRALYERASVFIFPSIYEGFGIPPLEAMTCGCPVVASNASSIPEVCGDAVIYFDPLDQNSLLSALTQVLNDQALRNQLVERGRLRSENYSWDRSASLLRAALAEFGYVC